jgi:hypothetical protein
MKYLLFLSYLYNILENPSSFIICMPAYRVYIYVYMYIVRGESLLIQNAWGMAAIPICPSFFFFDAPK